jgi:hypothetical protein
LFVKEITPESSIFQFNYAGMLPAFFLIARQIYTKFIGNRRKRANSMGKSPFLESISDFMLTRRYSKRTVETYLTWIKAYIIFLIFCDFAA